MLAAVAINAPVLAQVTTDYTYDAQGQLAGVRRNGNSAVYSYDSAGNRTSVRQGVGPSIQISPDFAASRGYSNQTVYPRFMADVNGDGRQDMIALGHAATYVALGQADGSLGSTFVATTQFSYALSWTDANLYPRMAADLNNDKRADIVGFGADAVFFAFGQGDGTFGPLQKAIDGFGLSATWSSQNAVPRLLGDVNGDHFPDIVGIGRDSVVVALGRGDGTFSPAIVASTEFTYNRTWTSQNQYPRTLGDINGDGRADLIGFSADGVWVAVGQQNGTFASARSVLSTFGEAAGGWTSFDTFPRLVGDANHDGRADIVGFSVDGVTIALGRVDGSFGTPTNYASPYAGSWGAQSTRPRMLGDTDGDGWADLIAVGADGTFRQRLGL